MAKKEKPFKKPTPISKKAAWWACSLRRSAGNAAGISDDPDTLYAKAIKLESAVNRWDTVHTRKPKTIKQCDKISEEMANEVAHAVAFLKAQIKEMELALAVLKKEGVY